MTQIISYLPSHKQGFTSINLCNDGRLISGGFDGKVLIWSSISDENPEEHIVSEKINFVIQWGSHFISATDSTMVQLHSIEDGLPDGIATRFTAEVNHLAVNKEGTKLAAGASDFIVKLIELVGDDASTERKEFSFSGHSAPVLSVSLDPLDMFMASSSCDGCVKIWSIDSLNLDSNRTPLKSWNILPKYNDMSLAESRSRLAWEPVQGNIFAVASDKEIRLIERNSWDTLRFLRCHLINQPLADIAFSRDGVYLAGSSNDGWLIVWKVDEGDIVSKFKHPKGLAICSIDWHPIMEQTIVFSDLNGYVGVVRMTFKASETNALQTVSGDDALSAEDIAALMGDDDDDDLLSSAAHQQSKIQEVKIQEEDVDNNDDDDDNHSVDISKLKASFMIDSDDSMDGNKKDLQNVNQQISGVTPVRLPPPHKPFQPGGAPIGLSQRIMLWNRVGLVIQYDSEDDQSIEVEFHDTTFHHNIHINNTHNYVLADLNEFALVLCSQCESSDQDDEDTDSRSQLHVQPLSVANHDWRISMPAGESVCCCCAIGGNHVAVITDATLLRVFTLLTGVQVGMMSLPGSSISICGYGNSLMVICQQGMVGPLLQYKVIDLVSKSARSVQSGWSPLPLSKPSSQLVWCGFSEYGTPFIVDSEGVVRSQIRQWNSEIWVPVQNLKRLMKESSDCYFIVGVMESMAKLQALYCKANTYPHTLPRPSVDLIDFCVPACDRENDKEGLEEEYLRVKITSNMTHHLTEETNEELFQTIEAEAAAISNQHKAVLLKMFALALKLDQEVRCMEVAELMPDAAAVQLAIRYAAKLRRNQLCERLGELALKKEQEALQGEQLSEEEDSINEVKMSRKKKRSRKASDSCSESSDIRSEAKSPDQEARSESDEERDEILGRDDSAENSRDFETQDHLSRKENIPVPYQPLSLSKNPFKKLDNSADVSFSSIDKSQSFSGTQIFDNLSKSSFTQKNTSTLSSSSSNLPNSSSGKQRSQTKSNKKQATLFGKQQIENVPPKSKKPKKIIDPKSKSTDKKILNEWFEDNRPELEEEFPEKSAEEIFEIAQERFYSEIKDAQNSTSVKSKQSGQSKKRKAEINDLSEPKRASLCSNTKSKLSSFSFD